MSHVIVNLDRYNPIPGTGRSEGLENVVFPTVRAAADEVMRLLPAELRKEFARRVRPFIEGAMFRSLNWVVGAVWDQDERAPRHNYEKAWNVNIAKCKVRP